MILTLILAVLTLLLLAVGYAGYILTKSLVQVTAILSALDKANANIVKLNNNTVEAGATIARNTARSIPLNRL